MHHNIQNKGERGVAIYVSSDLESIFVESASHGPPEFVFIKLEIEKGQRPTEMVIFGYGRNRNRRRNSTFSFGRNQAETNE